MARNIFIVDSYLCDANGAFSHFQGFPKSFDSNNYGDVDTAKKRANATFASQVAAMNSAAGDTRQIQMVVMMDISGFQIDRQCVGQLVQDEQEPAEEDTTTE